MNKKTRLFVILCSLAAAMTIASNITAGKPMALPFGLAATSGIITVPISYIVSDVVAEVYGWKSARFSIILAYGLNLLVVVVFLIALAIPGASTFDSQEAFETVLGQTPRILIASALGFFVGSLSNAKIMDIMHVRDGESKLAFRCILSTLVGEVADKLLFVSFAFAFVLPWEVMATMIISQSIIGCVYETIAYPIITRHVINWAKSL